MSLQFDAAIAAGAQHDDTYHDRTFFPAICLLSSFVLFALSGRR